MIYERDGWFSISSHQVWVPGLFATRAAARWAFQFPDEVLSALSKRICSIHGENRPITTDDLRAARRPAPKS